MAKKHQSAFRLLALLLAPLALVALLALAGAPRAEPGRPDGAGAPAASSLAEKCATAASRAARLLRRPRPVVLDGQEAASAVRLSASSPTDRPLCLATRFLRQAASRSIRDRGFAERREHSDRHLVAVGGGGTGAEILARALELAGGPRARVVVLAQASERAEAGEESAAMWRAAGAREARAVDLADLNDARGAIRSADLIWMSGGSQERLLAALDEAGLAEEIRHRHAAGAVVGGTSAGAAVLSERTITGRADLERIAAGATETVPGLALWPGVIVDQHALRRRRLNRLIAAVLDRPTLVGVAIDERTAVVVDGTRIEVLGESSAIVVDARGAAIPALEEGRPSAGTGLRLHVLRSGMALDLAAAGR